MTDANDTGLRCTACGDPILDDQTVIRLALGVGRPTEGFSHALMRDDVYLHAGHPPGPWDEPTNERWCATPEGYDKALWMLRLHATSGASGRYRGD